MLILHYTRLENLARDKHSSLLRISVNYGCNKFYSTGPSWGHCYKTFYVCNLRIFILSSSICENRLEKLVMNKHSTLLQKLVNYGQNSFITLSPVQVYPNFLAYFLLSFLRKFWQQCCLIYTEITALKVVFLCILNFSLRFL